MFVTIPRCVRYDRQYEAVKESFEYDCLIAARNLKILVRGLTRSPSPGEHSGSSLPESEHPAFTGPDVLRGWRGFGGVLLMAFGSEDPSNVVCHNSTCASERRILEGLHWGTIALMPSCSSPPLFSSQTLWQPANSAGLGSRKQVVPVA